MKGRYFCVMLKIASKIYPADHSMRDTKMAKDSLCKFSYMLNFELDLENPCRRKFQSAKLSKKKLKSERKGNNRLIVSFLFTFQKNYKILQKHLRPNLCHTQPPFLPFSIHFAVGWHFSRSQ